MLIRWSSAQIAPVRLSSIFPMIALRWSSQPAPCSCMKLTVVVSWSAASHSLCMRAIARATNKIFHPSRSPLLSVVQRTEPHGRFTGCQSTQQVSKRIRQMVRRSSRTIHFFFAVSRQMFERPNQFRAVARYVQSWSRTRRHRAARLSGKHKPQSRAKLCACCIGGAAKLRSLPKSPREQASRDGNQRDIIRSRLLNRIVG